MTHWQDIVLAICVLVFNIALVPSVLGKSKPQLSTSLTTALFVAVQAIVYGSLSLWYSFVMSGINAILWGTLAFQKWSKGRS